MKRILFTLTALVFGIAYSFADTRQVVMLFHQGTGTEYAYDQLQQALDDATAGDTLYLNDGDYPINGDALTISHPVSIIGMGINTRLLGSVDISIPDSVTLTSYLLDALRVNGDVRVQQPVNGLKYRKCWFNGTLVWNATTRDAQIDRCYINNFDSSTKLNSANVINCKMFRENITSNNIGNNVLFINCAINNIIVYIGNSSVGHKIGYSYSTYMNCIIYNLTTSPSPGIYSLGDSQIRYSSYYNSALNNSLYNNEKVGIKENCYMLDNYTLDWEQNNGCNLTQEELIERGFLGTDGTVVGPEGGSAPYTLIPSGISVRESKLTIDGENRTLNVRLKLTSN